MWPKKKPSQRHISEFGELDGGFLDFFYKGANQIGNDIYYRGEKHY